MLRHLAVRGVAMRPKVYNRLSLVTPFFATINYAGRVTNFNRERWNFTSTNKNSNDYSSTEKLEKNRKGKRERPKLKKRNVANPVMSRTEARELYNKLAPHVRLKVIRDICVLLNKRKNTEGNYKEIVRELWEESERCGPDPPLWMQQEIKAALLDKKFREKTYKKKYGYAPAVNRENWQKHLLVLIQERDNAAHARLLWSKAQKEKLIEQCLLSKQKSSEMEGDEGQLKNATKAELDKKFNEKFSDISAERLARHGLKNEAQLKEEAEKLLEDLVANLPSESFLELMTFFGKFSSATLWSPTKEIYLLTDIENCVKSHLPSVVDDIAKFMYLDTMDTDFDNSRITKWKKEWALVRERFATILPAFQQSHLEKAKKLKESKKKLEVEAVDIQIRKKDSQKDIEMGDEVNSAPDEVKKRKEYHVKLDVTMLIDTLPSVPYGDRIIFVDNLPIDVSEVELFELYSRCGPIQSISICNQRQDLDPGKLSPKLQKERKRRMCMNRDSPFFNNNWQRPKTPVYCQITFANSKGAQLAIDPHLHLFGMVVRKHAMRSLKVSDLNKLYVENLPKGLHSVDLEYHLAKHLEERDMYVSLDLGQPKKSEPTSCEITFPSFEVALLSHDAVKESIDSLCENYEFEQSKTAVNWIQTPEDAMKHWTREVGFY